MDKRKFIFGLALFSALIIVFAFNAGLSSVDMASALEPFSSQHPLGTDTFGRDILSRLSLGALISIALAFIITIISTSAGLVLSFFMDERNLLSSVAWFFSDSIKSLGSVILALFLSSVFSPGFAVIIVSISLSQIPSIARTSYSRLVIVRNEEFVTYAESEGMGKLAIAMRHLIPHVMGEVSSQALGVFSSSILTESALSFLGSGIPVLYPSLGSMMNEGRTLMLSHPSLVVIPALTLFLITLSLNLMYEASESYS